jgi:hypothetical protein
MVFRGCFGLLAVLFCGVVQAASSGLYLDVEPADVRSIAGNPAMWGMFAYAGQPQPEPAREDSDLIDRSGNAGGRTDNRSFYTVSPVLSSNVGGGGKLPHAEIEDPIPEPYGAILVPPVVGRRRLI